MKLFINILFCFLSSWSYSATSTFDIPSGQGETILNGEFGSSQTISCKFTMDKSLFGSREWGPTLGLHLWSPKNKLAIGINAMETGDGGLVFITSLKKEGKHLQNDKVFSINKVSNEFFLKIYREKNIYYYRMQDGKGQYSMHYYVVPDADPLEWMATASGVKGEADCRHI